MFFWETVRFLKNILIWLESRILEARGICWIVWNLMVWVKWHPWVVTLFFVVLISVFTIVKFFEVRVLLLESFVMQLLNSILYFVCRVCSVGQFCFQALYNRFTTVLYQFSSFVKAMYFLLSLSFHSKNIVPSLIQALFIRWAFLSKFMNFTQAFMASSYILTFPWNVIFNTYIPFLSNFLYNFGCFLIGFSHAMNWILFET